jgi:hypothetical protein
MDDIDYTHSWRLHLATQNKNIEIAHSGGNILLSSGNADVRLRRALVEGGGSELGLEG